MRPLRHRNPSGSTPRPRMTRQSNVVNTKGGLKIEWIAARQCGGVCAAREQPVFWKREFLCPRLDVAPWVGTMPCDSLPPGMLRSTAPVQMFGVSRRQCHGTGGNRQHARADRVLRSPEPRKKARTPWRSRDRVRTASHPVRTRPTVQGRGSQRSPLHRTRTGRASLRAMASVARRRPVSSRPLEGIAMDIAQRERGIAGRTWQSMPDESKPHPSFVWAGLPTSPNRPPKDSHGARSGPAETRPDQASTPRIVLLFRVAARVVCDPPFLGPLASTRLLFLGVLFCSSRVPPYYLTQCAIYRRNTWELPVF